MLATHCGSILLQFGAFMVILTHFSSCCSPSADETEPQMWRDVNSQNAEDFVLFTEK